MFAQQILPDWLVNANPTILALVAVGLWLAGKVVSPETPAGKVVQTLKDLWAKLTGKVITTEPTVAEQVAAYERLRAVLHRKGDCDACDLMRKHLWARIGSDEEAASHKEPPK